MFSKRKKVLVVIAAVFGVLLLTAIALPFLIDVDAYRPRLIEEVNKRISGKVSIDKLRLSVFSGLKVNIDGFRLESNQGKEFFSLDNAVAKSSFWAAVFGRPYVSLSLDKAAIDIKRLKNGKIDLLEVFKKEGSEDAVAVETSPSTDEKAQGLPWYLGLFANAKFHFILDDGSLNVVDQITNADQKLSSVDFYLKNIGINQPMSLDLTGELLGKMDKKLKMGGLFKVFGTLEATTKNQKLHEVSFKITKDLSDFDISYDTLFKKSKGVPLKFDASGSYLSNNMVIESLGLQLNETTLDGKGEVKNLDQPDASINFEILSNKINLDSWHKLLPAIKSIAGEGSLQINLSETLKKPRVKLDVNMQKASMQLEKKAKPFNVSGDIFVEKFEKISVAARLQMFSGKVDVLTNLDLNQKIPRYTVSTTVSGLDVKSATEVFLTDFDNTLTGKLSMKGTGSGAGLAGDQIIKNLVLKGNFSLKDSSFKTFDLMSVANKGIQSATKGVSNYFPDLQSKLSAKIKDVAGEYDEVKSSFSLAKAGLNMPDFSAKAKKGEGLDFSGDTKINLVSKKLKAEWQVIDTYDKLDLQKVDISYKGQEIKNALAEKDGIVHIPITAECEFVKPCFKYDRTIKYFRKKVEHSIQDKVKSIFKDKTKKEINKVKDKVKKKAKDEIKNLLKKIGW